MLQFTLSQPTWREYRRLSGHTVYRMVAAPGLSASRFVRDLSSFVDKLQQISSTSCAVIRELRNRERLYKSKLLLTFTQVTRSCARICTIQDTKIYFSRGWKTGVQFCCAHRLVGLWGQSGSAPTSLWAVCSIWTEAVPTYFCLSSWTSLEEKWSLYVPHSGHYTYRPVVTICTASGHYMYRQFNIQQFYVLPTHCIYVFCVDLRTNSDYFPIQH
jgi:hypothetical protein